MCKWSINGHGSKEARELSKCLDRYIAFVKLDLGQNLIMKTNDSQIELPVTET